MFQSSHPFLVFDELRVPYRTGGVEAPAGFGRLTAGGRSLLWPLEPERIGAYSLGPTPFRPQADRDEDGNIVLPFDPNALIEETRSESYQERTKSSVSRLLKTGARRTYYRVKPVLPRAVQLRLRRAFTKVQERSPFPRWPVEPALHDLQDWVMELAEEVAGEPVPRIATWPGGRAWALVLTHDVETELGYRNMHLLRGIEEEFGCRSSWNLVARRYGVEQDVVDELTAAGFEVGVHGLYHDGLDLDSEATLRKRLPEIRMWAERWGSVGFRSPALHRNWDWMRLLGFDYDSSYPDTDPYEPKAGGCLSWLPFFNGELVELPVTLTQDHTLFEILRTDARVWFDKTALLRERGGMALALTHPDYMLDEDRLDAYRRFLDEFASDPTAWKALPREVSAWWRRRAASELELVDGEWQIVGPAAGEATVEFGGAPAPSLEKAVA